MILYNTGTVNFIYTTVLLFARFSCTKCSSNLINLYYFSVCIMTWCRCYSRPRTCRDFKIHLVLLLQVMFRFFNILHYLLLVLVLLLLFYLRRHYESPNLRFFNHYRRQLYTSIHVIIFNINQISTKLYCLISQSS